MTVIPEKGHSRIGPSQFARVETCPASPILSAALEPEPASIYAAEGTAAHEVMEHCLREGHDPVEYVGQTFYVGPHVIEFDVGHAEALAPCVRYIRDLPSERQEYEVKLTIPRTEMKGYADVISDEKALAALRFHEERGDERLAHALHWHVENSTAEAPLLRVADLKFGAGVDVSENAVQLALYGLMALLYRDPSCLRIGDDHEPILITTVMQPRAPGPTFKSRAWMRIEMIHLLERVFEVIERLERRTMRYKSGEHCRWCPAIAICPQLRMEAKDAVMAQAFADPSTLENLDFDKEKLEEILEWAPTLERYLAALNTLAMRYLESGGSLRTHKLVEKRAQRKWIDETEAREWIEERGLNPWQEPKMASPAQVEKLLPPKVRAELAPLYTKESSGLTITTMDDPREAYVDKVKRIKAARTQAHAQTTLQRAKALR